MSKFETTFSSPVLTQLKIKIFCSCSRFKTCLNCLVSSKLSVLWSQLNDKLYFVVIFYFFSTIWISFEWTRTVLFEFRKSIFSRWSWSSAKWSSFFEFAALFPTLQHNDRHTLQHNNKNKFSLLTNTTYYAINFRILQYVHFYKYWWSGP